MNIILLTIKIEHSSFYGEDALLFIFIVTIDIFLIQTNVTVLYVS